MPIASPDAYAEMLDRAKAGAFAYPAINVTSSQTLNAALRGFAEEDGIVGAIDEKLYSTVDDGLATVAALGLGEQGRYMAAMTFGNVHGVYKPGNVKLRPEILKEIQDAVGAKYGKEKPLNLVFHGGSGSLLSEIREALDYGVVKMNLDTDTQYAFTRPVAGHMFANYDG